MLPSISLDSPPGRGPFGLIRQTGRFFLFSLHVFLQTRHLFTHRKELRFHLSTILFRSVIPVCGIVSPVALVMCMQGIVIFKLFSAERLLSYMVGQTVFREVGPVLTAVIMAAQGGASYAAELGAMRLQHQIDATEVMGVDPIAFHISPRVIALIIAGPILYLVGAVSGVFTSYLAAVFLYGQNSGAYIDTLIHTLSFQDPFNGAIKACVFATTIALISCHAGYSVRGGAVGVGIAVNKAVVYSVVAFLILNYFLSAALFAVDL